MLDRRTEDKHGLRRVERDLPDTRVREIDVEVIRAHMVHARRLRSQFCVDVIMRVWRAMTGGQ